MLIRYFVRSTRVFAVAATLAACASGGGSMSTLRTGVPGGVPQRELNPSLRGRSPIKHVVIIVQENRTVDNLFQFLPGANTQSYGLNSSGQTVPLQPRHMTAAYDPSHTHANWTLEYAGGAMNGFDKEGCVGTGVCPVNAAYAYVPKNEVEPYYTLAETYTFADEFFETDQAPSFVSHQYLVSGTSTVSDSSRYRADDNPQTATGQYTGGCDSPAGTLVSVIAWDGFEPPSLHTYPCFQRQALMNELDTAGITWKYYQATTGPGIWNAVDAIDSIWSKPSEMAANVITPPSQVLTDVANRNLASVAWVTPTKLASDHPKETDGTGPSWVSSVVNAIGTSKYWSSTAIFIVWDDWGGFYDHVTPTIYNSLELGFRVPLIVVSPYAKRGYVSHAQHEFGSILKFTEETFGLPSLGTTDKRADDLSDCFNFRAKPSPYKYVHAPYSRSYFLHQRSTGSLDD
jgi:phospholipase C